MINFREFAEDAADVIIPNVRNAGDYVCVIGKNVKDGFSSNKKRITNYLSKKDNKNKVLDILLIILVILTTIAVIIELCDSIASFRENRRNRKKRMSESV